MGRHNAETVRAELDKRAEDLFRLAFGEPVRASGREWRSKAHGSRKMVMQGPRRGEWFVHSGGYGGDLFDLVAIHICGMPEGSQAARADFPTVLEAAAQWCGLTSDAPPPDRKAIDRRKREREQERQREQEEAERQARATVEMVQGASLPISGTPAAIYLAARGIEVTDGADDGLAFTAPLPPTKGIDHREHSALTIFGMDGHGAMRGGQRILLTMEGARAEVAGKRPKLTFGQVSGFPARFPSKIEGGPLYVAEGPETALSVWLATGCEVWAVFGVSFFRTAPLPSGRRVILCPDRDAPVGTYPAGSDEARQKESAARAFEDAVRDHLAAGVDLWIAEAPEPEGSKRDLNDTHRRAGIEAVREALANARPARSAPPPPSPGGLARIAPTYTAPTGSRDEARDVVSRTLDRWGEAVLSWTGPGDAEDRESDLPPAFGLRVTTGVGKSHSAREKARAVVQAVRERGDRRSVAIPVPTHDLAGEYAEALKEAAEEAGLSVETYRGRMQPDPTPAEGYEGGRMCLRAEEAEEIEHAGGRVSDTLCRQAASPAAPATKCPLFDLCGTQRQKSARADLWLVPHSLLFRERPACLGDLAGIIVDEDPTSGMFAGFGGPPMRLTTKTLRAALPGLTPGENADLGQITGAIAAAVEKSPDGRIIPADLGLSENDLTDARKLAFSALRSPECGPHSSPKEIREAARKVAKTNKRVKYLATLLKAVREALANGAAVVPGLTCEAIETPDGDAAALRLRWRQGLAKDWHVPTAILTATGRDETLRGLWPQLGAVEDAAASMKHTHVRQIVDRAFGQSSLVPGETASPETAGTARRTLARLARYIEVEAARHAPRPVLVIAQKAVIEALREMGMPGNIRCLHFGALEGVDRFRDVPCLIQIGRPLPSPSDVELRAELLTGDAVQGVDGWYDKAPAALTMREGAGLQVFTRRGKGGEIRPGTDRHPDPTAEAIRWGICEGALLQGIGRARGVNRTAETPLNLHILTNVPLPIEVDEADTFKNFEPTTADLMEARGIRVPEPTAKGGYPLISAVVPDLYQTANAARFAANRGEPLSRDQNPISILLQGYDRVSAWVRGRAKVAGGRYAVSVEIRAETAEEAQTLLFGMGLELVGGVEAITAPAPPRKALSRAESRGTEISDRPDAGASPPEEPTPTPPPYAAPVVAGDACAWPRNVVPFRSDLAPEQVPVRGSAAASWRKAREGSP